MGKASMYKKTIAPKYTPSLTKLLNKTKRQKRNTFYFSYNLLALLLGIMVLVTITESFWLALAVIGIPSILTLYSFSSITKSLKARISQLDSDVKSQNIVIYQTKVIDISPGFTSINKIIYMDLYGKTNVIIIKEKRAKEFRKLLIDNKYYPYVAYIITAEKSGEILDLLTSDELLSHYID